eukprot:scaffold90928_cov28-Tisochrysis_lutea.AAC.3
MTLKEKMKLISTYRSIDVMYEISSGSRSAMTVWKATIASSEVRVMPARSANSSSETTKLVHRAVVKKKSGITTDWIQNHHCRCTRMPIWSSG